jgi:hypothetical protein
MMFFLKAFILIKVIWHSSDLFFLFDRRFRKECDKKNPKFGVTLGPMLGQEGPKKFFFTVY